MSNITGLVPVINQAISNRQGVLTIPWYQFFSNLSKNTVSGATVASVNISGANGINVTGNPITVSGTIALSLGNITPAKVQTTTVTASNVVISGTVAAATVAATTITAASAILTNIAASTVTTALLTIGTSTPIVSTVAFNNGAAGQIATMTNSPTAGNPTKWIPINDNGTIRYIPSW